MAWINVTEKSQAAFALKQAYDEVLATRGHVANIFQAQSVNPGAMTAHLRLYRELMYGGSLLTRMERELIAVTVSALNHCHY